MEVKVKTSNLRISPRKVKIVADLLRNKKAKEVLIELKYLPNKAAGLIAKTVNSAIANAKNNFNLDENQLFITEIKANQGQSYKRIKFRARGGRDIVIKRNTHLTVVLSTTEKLKKKSKKSKKTTKPVVKEGKIEEVKEIKEKPQKEYEVSKKEFIKEKIIAPKRFFRRKGG